MFVKICLTFRFQKCVKNSGKNAFPLHSLVFKKDNIELWPDPALGSVSCGVCKQNAMLRCKDSALEATMCVSKHGNDLQDAKG